MEEIDYTHSCSMPQESEEKDFGEHIGGIATLYLGERNEEG